MAPGWVSDTIWWQLYPLGFTGAPIRTAHDRVNRFTHLEAWLDYVIELGASGIILGPVFTSSTHGYDTLDLFEIDPRLGTEEDYANFISECHARGLRVVLDGVFNHVGYQHEWVRDVRERGSESEFADLVSWNSEGGSINFGNFEGHGSLVTLNHASPRVQQIVADVMIHWLRLGADGWRLDAAYSVPLDFWASVLPRVREEFPEAWFVGEVIHGDYAEIATESTMDSLTQYELWKALWSSLVDANYYELAAALDRHNNFLDFELPLTFVGNHDVSRIATQVGGPASVLALTALLTLGGTPAIYYGDELGYRGIKEEREGGDDEVRPLMPQTPGDLGPLGRDLLSIHRELIALRRRHPWLTQSRSEVLELQNKLMVFRSKGGDEEQSLITRLNIDGGFRATVEGEDGDVLFDYVAGAEGN